MSRLEVDFLKNNKRRTAQQFSMAEDADKAVSTHFKVREFACRDGSDKVLISENLVKGLEILRDRLNTKYQGEVYIQITSGYRTYQHNRRIGGARQSLHLSGLAADIKAFHIHPVSGKEQVPPNIVRQIADEINFGGVGKYSTFTHVDVYGSKRRWRR